MAKSNEELLAENEELLRSLNESQELLRAIKGGDVDALVISGSQGEQVFTLEGADHAYRVLIEAMNDGAVTMTSDGTILYCNRHFAEMMKSSLEKVIGSSIYRFIHQPDLVAFRTLQKGSSRGELNLTAEDESIMPVYISINPMQLSDSEEAFCVVITDLTEQKKIIEELRKSNEAAKAAVKAKSAFLANMSHEIRTPMNAVIGMTDLMLGDTLTPEHRENLELIRTNGDALLTIINDILDFSKIESDKLVLEEQPFELRKLIEEALDLVGLKAAEKGLNLSYTIDKNTPETIISDPGRLRQVLGNLLSNAVKFTDEGEVALSISMDRTNEIHFAVRDTGIGIPQDRMNLLFQPFNQMEPSTHRLYGGTGLGLAISKNLVELMNGRIWAESQADKGSTFHFIIKISSQSEPQHNEVIPILIGKRLLIVSENKTNRHILSKQAYDWGMVPMIVTSGQEALKYIHRGDNHDIAILDMDLKGMSGLELEKEIRKYNKTLPLILLTSLGQSIPPNHAYLTKPIKPSQLHNALTDILATAQSIPTRRQIIAMGRLGQSKPLRILLAEDNVSSQKVVQRMLNKLGYKADIAANGIEALQALERQPYDVVLMDIKMPEMDGFEATRLIRQRWPNNGLKIIAITAYALSGDREKCLEAGMNDYIAKPVRIQDLEDALKDTSRL